MRLQHIGCTIITVLAVAGTSLAQCQLLLKETFRFGDRPHGGGNIRAAELEDVLKDWWPQVPADGTQWISVDANTPTWRFGASNIVESEVPADGTGGNAWGIDGAVALIPFVAPTTPITVRFETVLFGGVPYVGFTTSAALLNNFETGGALWMTLDDLNNWSVYANGMQLIASGSSIGMGTLDTGYLHMEFTYDPAASTVSGRVQEMYFGPVPVTLTRPLTYFGMEAHGGMVAMNNIAISTGTPVTAVAQGPASVCNAGTVTLSVNTNAAPSAVIRWCDQGGGTLHDGVTPTGAVISGAHTPTLTITGITAADGSQFFATIASECGTVLSNRVQVNIGGCAVDFNCSGSADLQDIFDFLSAWFGRQPSADINHDSGITTQDIFDFLSGWFAGC